MEFLHYINVQYKHKHRVFAYRQIEFYTPSFNITGNYNTGFVYDKIATTKAANFCIKCILCAFSVCFQQAISEADSQKRDKSGTKFNILFNFF